MTDNVFNIPCEGGLDVVTPRINLPPGRLSDCLNYDVDSNGGYRRVGGEFPYTGETDFRDLHFYTVKGQWQTDVSLPRTVYYDSGASTATMALADGQTYASGTDQYYIIYDTTADMSTSESITSDHPIGFDFTIAAGEQINRYNVNSVHNGDLPCKALAQYYQILYDQYQASSSGNPVGATNGNVATGMFYYDNKLHVIGDDSETDLYRENGSATNSWDALSLGQEMAFNNGRLEMKFEDYIIWDGASATDEDEIKNDYRGGTSDATTLDYFPGRIIYWRDSTDTNREYWATVVHAYVATGTYAGTDAEGALTLYDQYDRTNGGTLTSTADGGFPLSSTGSFGLWTEGNALNFTSGGTYEPQIGDQITDGGGQTATVLKVIVDAGTWAGGDATGTLVVGEISGTGTWASSTNLDIGANVNVLTTANAINDTARGDILDNTSTNIDVSLPSDSDLISAKSAYVSIIHNFLATDGASNPTAVRIPEDKCYLTNGTGFALQWDGQHLVRIRTGALVSADKPRHVSVHANRLCLGYGDGTLVMSVEGQPLNFSGADGALVFGFSHPITGLVALSGDTTAVFTDSTVEMLQGTNDTNFVQRKISLDSGAIEYTAVDMGTVVYCDRHGIATLTQTEAYGDFNRNRISSLIYPWLDHRVNKTYPQIQAFGTPSLSQQPAYAIPVPSRNQYRLFFNDGYILTCTMGTSVAPNYPVATVQRIEAVADGTYTIDYQHMWTYGVDSNGRDVQFIIQRAGFQTADMSYPAIRMLDVHPINTDDKPAYVTIGPLFNSSPITADTMNTLNLYGAYQGCTSIGMEFLEGYSSIHQDLYADQPTAQITETIDNADGVFRDVDFFEKEFYFRSNDANFYLRFSPNDNTRHTLHNVVMQSKNRRLER